MRKNDPSGGKMGAKLAEGVSGDRIPRINEKDRVDLSFSYPLGESNAYHRNRNPEFYPLN